jgi:hypothetical protein
MMTLSKEEQVVSRHITYTYIKPNEYYNLIWNT